MLKSYLILTIRNILKYKAYAFINILGLPIGMAGALSIGLYILNEMKVDKFHARID